ncbi:Hydroxyacid dehydrogenase [Entamoeba marina]
MNIVVLEAQLLGDASFAKLQQYGNVVIYLTTTKEELISRIEKADIVLVSKVVITSDILKQCPNVRLIALLATGYNNIDIDYCKEHNIAVANVANYSTNAVAQHTLALLLELYNKLYIFDTFIKSGGYSSNKPFSMNGLFSHGIDNKKWCICGLGSIGKRVAKIASALGANVCYYSTSGRNSNEEYQQVTFSEMLQCDIISLHCPLNESTKGMFTYDVFKQMKNTSVLINVGRGPLVVSNDVAKALSEGLIMGYASDVFEVEPLPITSPLLSEDIKNKIVMSPHIAWASIESRDLLVNGAMENVESYLKGERRNRIV